jgi:hypothetical protein
LKITSQVIVTAAFVFVDASFPSFADQGSRQAHEPRLAQAQEVLAVNYVKKELSKLHHMEWSASQHKLSLNEVASCIIGEVSCIEVLESYISPPEFNQVSSACINVQTIHSDGAQTKNWSAEIIQRLSYSKFLLPIFHDDNCKTAISSDEYAEHQYRISVTFSECSDIGCSVRTQIKRNGDWCGYGRKTISSTSIVDGFEFSILDGIEEEIISEGSGLLTLNVKKKLDNLQDQRLQ